MDWPAILSQKAFWLYYLRWFQAFAGDRVAASCAFFGIDQAALEHTVLDGVYQINAEDEVATFHTLRLPLRAEAATLDIVFQNFGPNEHIQLTVGDAVLALADVDVDDARTPLFWLRDLPRLARGLRGPLAQDYGALLLYKLGAVAPDDDLDALATILRAALPPGLFTEREQARIVAIERRTWQVQQTWPRPLRAIAHPLWCTWLADDD